MFKIFGGPPSALIVVLLWAILRWAGVKFTLNSVTSSLGLIFSLGLISASMIALIVEFLKSSKTGPREFAIDLALAILAILIVSHVSAVFWWIHKTFYLVDLFIIALVSADGIVSVRNSFKVALRSFAAGEVRAGGESASE